MYSVQTFFTALGVRGAHVGNSSIVDEGPLVLNNNKLRISYKVEGRFIPFEVY